MAVDRPGAADVAHILRLVGDLDLVAPAQVNAAVAIRLQAVLEVQLEVPEVLVAHEVAGATGGDEAAVADDPAQIAASARMPAAERLAVEQPTAGRHVRERSGSAGARTAVHAPAARRVSSIVCAVIGMPPDVTDRLEMNSLSSSGRLESNCEPDATGSLRNQVPLKCARMRPKRDVVNSSLSTVQAAPRMTSGAP